MNKRLTLVALAATASVAGIAGAAGSASAESVTPLPGIVKQHSTSFTSPSEWSITVHILQPGTTVDAYCYRTGQAIGDNAVWFAINTDGETAYIHGDNLSVAKLPHC